ncbi:MAG: Pre-rRNA-processing protein ipi3 [Vezdaea aestivalis]|nr:MAG: Pre-rRNA-processing protein ipi3 [Vezdaea aestivalis]
MSSQKLTELIATATSGPASVKPGSSSTSLKGATIQILSVHNASHARETFKNCCAVPGGLAVSSSHVFAAQKDKAVVHVYSRSKRNQETLAILPERVTCLTFVGEEADGGVGVLIVGTEEGRIVLWQVATGRQIFSTASHIQKVTCIAASPSGTHILTGSADSTIQSWSLQTLQSFTPTSIGTSNANPLRTLSGHRAPITSLAVGHGHSPSLNIAVSASEDKTCVTWNYHSGAILHKIAIPHCPTALALDPLDRAFYIGFETGQLGCLDYYDTKGATFNVLSREGKALEQEFGGAERDANGEGALWDAKVVDGEVGSVTTLTVGYDGSRLLSGHEGGQIVLWNVGAGGGEKFDRVLCKLDYPVAALVSLPIEGLEKGEPERLRLHTTVKPKAEGVRVEGVPYHHTIVAQQVGLGDRGAESWSEKQMAGQMILDEMLIYKGGSELDGNQGQNGSADATEDLKAEVELLKKQLAEARTGEEQAQERFGKLQVEHAILAGEHEAARKRKKRKAEKEETAID